MPDLPIGDLVESKTNPRRHFDEAKLRELAQSAKEHGILEPLLVRPKNGKHEIVAGARRYRAAKIAELVTLPVRIMELGDAQALEIQVIENLQREDVHPLEEAEGYARLLKSGAYNADQLAAKVGKDRSYIYKRIQLTELIEPLKGKFLEGKIQIGHALLLCRLREPDQVHAAKDGLFGGYGANREVVGVDRLRDWIEREVYLNLAGAPWNKSDAQLVPAAGACTTCTKRTGANQLLFDDHAKGDRCLDRNCYQAKQAALVQLSIAKAGEKGVELIRLANGYHQRGKKHAAGVVDPDHWKEAVKSKCAKPESAIIVVGDDVGQKLQICRQKNCKHHGYSSYRSPQESLADKWRNKEAVLNREVDSITDQRIAGAIMDKVKKLGRHELRSILRLLVDQLGDEDQRYLAGAMGVDLAKLKKTKSYRDRPAFDAIIAASVTVTDKDLARAIVGALSLSIASTGWMAEQKKERADFDFPYKVDRKKIRAAVDADVKREFRKEKAAAFARAKAKAGKKKAAGK